MTLLGLETEDLNVTQTYLPVNSSGVINIAKDYGTAAGVGGTLSHYTGSIQLVAGKQVYDLKSLPTSSLYLETGSFSGNSKFTIRKIFHELPPAMVRFFDPMVQSGLTSDGMLDQFGWGKFSPGVSFVVAPLHWDVLRLQAIEFNDLIRKSGYSFSLTNDRLRIFPIPTQSMKLWFHYTLDDGDMLSQINAAANGVDKVSDYSNVPYCNVVYSKVNDIGKNWIRNYFLAVCKEILGRIRGKYGALPIPDGEISLNWSELLTESQQEKEALRAELKEYLDSFSRDKQLEKKAAEAQSLMDYLKFIPMKIYCGIFLVLLIISYDNV